MSVAPFAPSTDTLIRGCFVVKLVVFPKIYEMKLTSPQLIFHGRQIYFTKLLIQISLYENNLGRRCGTSLAEGKGVQV